MDRVNKFANIIPMQSKRLGQFMDWDNSYFTNSDNNITAIWHFLKVCHERGWLVQKYRPMPWCSHCGTSLSEHELADSYKDLTHKAVFFKLPIKNSNQSILAWTTTPWTLAGNVAIAVNPDFDYAICKVKSTTRELIVCKTTTKVLKDDLISVVKVVKGSSLIGLEYETCFEELPLQNFTHKIVAWDQVDDQTGTGAVHIAPGCGTEDTDFGLGKKLGLPEIMPVDEYGNYYENFGFLSLKPADDVAELVFEELEKRGKLYYIHDITHRYPVCWRCKKPLIYRLTKEWYIKVDEIRPQLIKALDDVEWQPSFLKKRMFDWLNNMGDWCISRKRFYGLPLPFYICEKCGKVHVIGSLEELKAKSDAKAVESMPHLHRPYIDEIEISCECGGKAKRVPDVGDCWLDAGITPFSTKKYFTDKEFFNKNFPAECVIEMREQIRLWFYSLLFMSVTLTGKAPYKKVIGFGMLTAEDGSKFSKSGSNNILLHDACDKFTADAVRFTFASDNLLQDKRFGPNVIEETKRKLLGLWNSFVFFNTYASLDQPDIANYNLKEENLELTDKWLLARVNELISVSHSCYLENKLYVLVKEVELFLDDLSNFYIRTNRKRFWKSENAEDQMVAYAVLYKSLKATCQILAPIIPFMTEYIWQHLVREIETNEAESILLSTYPNSAFALKDSDILKQTEAIRNIITLAQRLRNENNLKVKQPLAKMFVCATKEIEDSARLYESLIKEELNIKNIVFEQDVTKFNDRYLTVNFKTAGMVLKGEVQKLKAYLESLTQEQMNGLVKEYDNGNVQIQEFGKLGSDLFMINSKAKQDFVISTENDVTVVLDTNLTEELVLEGIFREIVRNAQVVRKEGGFNVEDRIIAHFETTSETLLKVLKLYEEKIKQDVLITEISNAHEFSYSQDFIVAGEPLKVKIKKSE